jgi:hypothetical protein
MDSKMNKGFGHARKFRRHGDGRQPRSRSPTMGEVLHTIPKKI